MTTKISLTLILILFSVPIFGEVGRVYRGKEYDVRNDIKVLSKEKLMILGLTIWDSALQDAERLIGKAPIKEIGTRPDDEAQLCYEGSDSILLLTSPDAYERRQRIQTAIVSRDKKIKELFSTCVKSDKINQDFTFMAGLRMGMTKTQVKKIWGEPGKETSDVIIYVIRRATKEYFTDDVSIYLEFKKDKLTYAWFSRTGIH